MSRDPRGPTPVTRVALAPDAPLVGAGVKTTLSKAGPEIEVVVLASSSEDPGPVDVVLYDPQRVALPELAVALASPRAVVLAFSWSCRPDLVEEARRQGAAAFLSKELSPAEVVATIRGLRAGHHHRYLIQPYEQAAESATAGRPLGLTQREFEVLELITAGLGNDEIARRLFVSINSVKSYVRTGYRKIGATRRAQAVLWGFEHGLAAKQPASGEMSIRR